MIFQTTGKEVRGRNATDFFCFRFGGVRFCIILGNNSVHDAGMMLDVNRSSKKVADVKFYSYLCNVIKKEIL